MREARSGGRAGAGGSGLGSRRRSVAGILRGELRWADLDPTRGHEQSGLRPVLILSHDVFNERSGTVIAMALTSQPQRAGFPLTLELTNAKLKKSSWLKISQIRTLSVERIGKRLGRVSAEELSQAIEGLNEIIGA
ncbi:MAG TPA: type II toxin-antitoxin system PemK/MazF family toxin [Polyangiaceae bacterium]|nr:type II toxin-antitoxin system PemK/MazF family toxin [Polyangiaceae bacterium]